MTRTAAREIAMHFSFSVPYTDMSARELLEQRFSPDYYPTLAQEYELYAQYPEENNMEYIRDVVSGIVEHAYELDSYIEKYSRGWRFERISRTAQAIMRLAMYEIMYMPSIPDGASVNEAVELAKKYEEQDVASFVNGILGSFVRGEKK